VRHPAWSASSFQEKLTKLLQELDKARVLFDTRPIRSLSGNKILEGSVYKLMLKMQERRSDQPILTRPAVGFTFLRFIGHPVMDQNAEFIDEWADHLAEALEQGRDAYAFCHCPDVRMDPWLCRDFHQQVQARLAIPPLPWDEIDTNNPGQSRFL